LAFVSRLAPVSKDQCFFIFFDQFEIEGLSSIRIMLCVRATLATKLCQSLFAGTLLESTCSIVTKQSLPKRFCSGATHSKGTKVKDLL